MAMLAIFSLALFCQITVQVHASCNSADTDSCLSPMQQYLTIWKSQQTTTLVNASCNAFSTANACVNGTGCNSADDYYRKFWAANTNAFMFLCANQQDFNNYQNCFSSGSAFQKCLAMNSPNGNANYHAWCNFYRRQLKCFSALTSTTSCITTYVSNLVSNFNQAAFDRVYYPYTCNVTSNDDTPPTCDLPSLQSCISDYLAPSNFNKPLDQALDQSTINTSCSLINPTTDCILESSGCTKTDTNYKLYWAGYESALPYICNDGYQSFIQYQSCFNVSGFSNGANKCFSLSPPSENPSASDWCNFYKSQLKCLRDLASAQDCVPNLFFDNYYTRYIQPSIDVRTPGCALSSADSGRDAMTIIILLATMLFQRFLL